MPGLIEGFVNPGLVLGTALAAVPVIIHLLNRSRHRPVTWAAMSFVLAAFRKTRRRVQLENLLLLLLRMVAIAALALAVARPFTESDSALGGLTESRRDVALVLDTSASTGFREEIDTVLERIVARARQLLGELDSSRGDRARVVLAGAWPRLAAWGDVKNGLAVLETIQEPTDEVLDLAAALGEVLEFAREEAASTEESRVEVRVLTDLQRGSFYPRRAAATEGEEPTGLEDVLDELAELGLVVLVEDLGPAAPVPPNLSIVALETEAPILGTRSPVDLRVTVANHGPDPRAAVRVALEVDGERRPSQVIDLPPRESAEIVFPLSFETSGPHVARALLEGDRLAADDTRVLVLEVPDPLRVLLVNGAPAAEVERDAAGRLLTVLEPAEEGPFYAAGSPFLPTEAKPREIESGDVELAGYDVVWLVDVDSLTADAVERLEEHVAHGAALIISLGDRVSAETFDDRLFRADGTGLSPAELLRPVAVPSRREGYFRVRAFDATHPALALFAEERWRALFTEAPFYRFWAARPLDGARVLASFDDPAGSPLLVEREYDRGRVLLWTSTFDESWTALPTWGPALVPLVFDLVRYAGSGGERSAVLAPGGTFSAEVTAFPRRVELVTPGGSRRTLDEPPLDVGGGRWRLPTIGGHQTARAGLYRLLTDGGEEVDFSVQIEPEESDLARLTPAELSSLHPAFEPYLPDEGGEEEPDLPRRGRLWRLLALAALAALVGESLWAAWIGGRRRMVR